MQQDDIYVKNVGFSIFFILFVVLAIISIKPIFAETESTFHLRVSATPNIIFLNGAGFYPKGEMVVVEKAPEEWQDYRFVGWKVDGTWTDDNPISVRMDKNHHAQAVYEKNNFIQLTIDSIPRIAEITVDDIVYLPSELPVILSVPLDTEFAISLKEIISENSNSRYIFERWKDLNFELDRQITLKENTELTALFKIQHFFNPISRYGEIEGGGWKDVGSKINFKLKSDIVVDKNNEKIRHTFDGWNYGYYQNSPENVIDVEGPESAVASWNTQYKLDIHNMVPDAKTFGSGWYDQGKTLTLVTEEELESSYHNTRYIFDRWTSRGINVPSISDPNSPIATITMDEPYIIEAKYNRSYLVNVWSPYGLVSGNGFYEEGDTAEISISTIQFEVEQNKVRKILAGWESPASRMVTFDNADGIGQQNLMVFVDKPMNVTAKWKTQYYLDVKSTQSETFGSGWYDIGKQTHFSVKKPSISPNFWSSHQFLGWSGDYEGELTKGSIFMNSPKVISAEWKEDNTLGVVNSILLAGVTAGGMTVYTKTKKKKKDSNSCQTTWDQKNLDKFSHHKINKNSTVKKTLFLKIKEVFSKIN